jgi:chorismate mutase
MLEKYRKQIDRIDSEILKLLSERLEISLKVGALKKDSGVKVIDLGREKKIFERLVVEGSKLGLKENYIKKVFEVIIRDSRKNQEF